MQSKQYFPNIEIRKISIFALAAMGFGISGGDRIFIEFAKRWAKFYPIKIYIWQEGYEMCQRQKLNKSGIDYLVSSMEPWKNFGFVINYLARIIEGIRLGFSLKLENLSSSVIYSASEFWMDLFPALILKIRFPRVRWIAAWFQTAPNPLVGFTEGTRYNRYRLKALIYYLIQLPTKLFISKVADFVLVNNEDERRQFPLLNAKGRVLVVLGAVNLKEIEKWRIKLRNSPKIYDGVFQGRFHPQKGVLELIDIWKIVVNQKKDAKLIMIGDGPLMKDVKLKIKKENLERNIVLKGYLFDGEEKYRIFSQSKVVIHPAFYDSGGMASAEAMAFGLPAVGFNLKSFESYYPLGMLKVAIGDYSSFAESILELLNSEVRRKKIGKDALNMINKSWSWDKRAKDLLDSI